MTFPNSALASFARFIPNSTRRLPSDIHKILYQNNITLSHRSWQRRRFASTTGSTPCLCGHLIFKLTQLCDSSSRLDDSAITVSSSAYPVRAFGCVHHSRVLDCCCASSCDRHFTHEPPHRRRIVEYIQEFRREGCSYRSIHQQSSSVAEATQQSRVHRIETAHENARRSP